MEGPHASGRQQTFRVGPAGAGADCVHTQARSCPPEVCTQRGVRRDAWQAVLCRFKCGAYMQRPCFCPFSGIVACREQPGLTSSSIGKEQQEGTGHPQVARGAGECCHCSSYIAAGGPSAASCDPSHFPFRKKHPQQRVYPSRHTRCVPVRPGLGYCSAGWQCDNRSRWLPTSQTDSRRRMWLHLGVTR